MPMPVPQTKKIGKKDASKKSAAMFEVTSMTTADILSVAKNTTDIAGDPVDSIIENAEIEQAHNEEVAEAKELGLETSPIIESTNSEIIKDLERQVEEAQSRYLEAIDDKNQLQSEISQIKKENKTLKEQILQLSSDYDLLKTDSSREIVDYKIDIEDLTAKIAIYEQNESNYKFDISKLRAEIANLENELDITKDKLESFEAKTKKQQNFTASKSSIPMYSSVPQQKPKKVAPPTNGYSAWN